MSCLTSLQLFPMILWRKNIVTTVWTILFLLLIFRLLASGMLHAAVQWPKYGMVSWSSEKHRVLHWQVRQLRCIHHLRYFPKSIKSDTKLQRVHQSLIEVISEYLLETFTEKKLQSKLIVTSNDVIPEETSNGVRQKRHDLNGYSPNVGFSHQHTLKFQI